MDKKEIREMRKNIGKALHEYYIQNGEENYKKFINKLSKNLYKEYGEPFSRDNLRIMEAEYVTFNAKFNGQNQSSYSKTSFKG